MRHLGGGGVTSESYFQQLLRLVYRLLFLFTAEERNLLHAPDATGEQRAIFAEGYALSRLRDRALRRRYYDRHGDLWQSLKITFGALAKGAPVLGLPALGGLFDPTQCPDLDAAAIANERLLDGIRSLAFFRSGTALARVNYRDMGTEELGSVYESLLELQPVVDTTSWTFSFVDVLDGQKSRGSQRKLTGSYYTPASLANELIKSALNPVLDEAISQHPKNPRKAILDLNIIDPACGSGHLLLAAARRMATEIMRIEAGTGSHDEATLQHALREVVQHCIYGVDRNPLAVELCKTALWMETVEPGKPLTFLDAHIHLGDSLVGIIDPDIMAKGIPGEAYKPLTGDDKTICQSLKKQNRQAGTSVPFDLFDDEGVVEEEAGADINAMPEETLADIRRKLRLGKKRNGMRSACKRSCVPICSSGPTLHRRQRKAPGACRIREISIVLPLAYRNVPGVKETVQNLANQHRFFHWHLVFKEIMQRGGFDVVLGNSPWGRVKLQEKGFFATRSREIATAPNKAARDILIKKLGSEDALPAERVLLAAYEAAKREYGAISQFVRTGGRFPLTGVGDVNTYALFAELFLHLTAPGGRAGIIVPSGIASDKSTSTFFEDIVGSRRLASLYDFENREAVFSSVHRSYKFCLLTLSGTDRPCAKAEFAFFCTRRSRSARKNACLRCRQRILHSSTPTHAPARSSVPDVIWRSSARCTSEQGSCGKRNGAASRRKTLGVYVS